MKRHRGICASSVAFLVLLGLAGDGVPSARAGGDGLWLRASPRDYTAPTCPTKESVRVTLTAGTDYKQECTGEFVREDGSRYPAVTVPAGGSVLQEVSLRVPTTETFRFEVSRIGELKLDRPRVARVRVELRCPRIREWTGTTLPTLPPGEGPQLPTLPPRRRQSAFKVTATRIRLVHETTESATELNGNGDEIKLVSWGCWYSATVAGPHMVPIESSFAIGDTGVGVSQANAIGVEGEANPRYRIPGGLHSGDVVSEATVRPPEGTFTTAAARRDLARHMLPVTLWQGDLREGDVVVLVPTIWELDDALPVAGSPFIGAYDSPPRESGTLGPTYAAGIVNHLRSHGPEYLARSHDAGFRFLTMHDMGVLRATRFPGDFSRPIGVRWELEGGSTLSGTVEFDPWTVRLSYDTATAAAASTANSDTGVAGDFDVAFDDDRGRNQQFAGHYVLTLHVGPP
jgi:hypothetical protein